MGHVEQRSYDPRYGALASVTSANGVIAESSSDGFGRVLSVKAGDGTSTETTYRRCGGNCPIGAAVVTLQETKGPGNVRIAAPVLKYADNTNRVIHTHTWGFDGRQILTDVSYDGLGRPTMVFWPRYAAEEDLYNTTPPEAPWQSHVRSDELDRPLLQRVQDESGQMLTTTHIWEGLTHRTTNPKQQQISETRDVWSKLVTTVDAAGKGTQFKFDAFGNLALTTDPKGNMVKVTYNDWGRRKELKDLDHAHRALHHLGGISCRFLVHGCILSKIGASQISGPVHSTLHSMERAHVTYFSLLTMRTAQCGNQRRFARTSPLRYISP